MKGSGLKSKGWYFFLFTGILNGNFILLLEDKIEKIKWNKASQVLLTCTSAETRDMGEQRMNGLTFSYSVVMVKLE